jgi:hypothetical protein
MMNYIKLKEGDSISAIKKYAAELPYGYFYIDISGLKKGGTYKLLKEFPTEAFIICNHGEQVSPE